jgi:hypothetical protein
LAYKNKEANYKEVAINKGGTIVSSMYYLIGLKLLSAKFGLNQRLVINQVK